MTVGVYDNCYTCWNSCPANPSDKCGSLRSLFTDTNRVGFASNTSVENVDVVTASGKIDAGGFAQCNVGTARGVVIASAITQGDVIVPAGVGPERPAPSAVLLLPMVL